MNLLSFSKLKNWEYWPPFMFYIPNVPYAAYLALKARNLVFFSVTNPALKHSGNGSESKFDTLKLISKSHKPVSIFIRKNETIENVIEKINQQQLKYPLIIKPDIGFRGLLVKQLKTEKDLKIYLSKNNCIDLILQEFIDLKNECGIFYHRIPSEKKGQITSITLKKNLTITGDGKSTINELIKDDERAKYYIDIIKKLHHKNLNIILKKGEEKVLNVIGNHSKGTKFIDGNHLISEDLTDTMEAFFKKIPHFFYGRIDLKYNSFEQLIQKNEFKVLEINGIISEPTHIYDSEKGSYFKALKQIRKHWKIIYQIAIQNKKNGHHFDSVSNFLKSILQLKKYINFIKKTY